MKTVFVPNLEYEDWRCAMPQCRCLLGRKHPGGEMVVKYKDFSLRLAGDDYDLRVECRKCGAINRLKVTGIHELMRKAEDGTTETLAET